MILLAETVALAKEGFEDVGENVKNASACWMNKYRLLYSYCESSFFCILIGQKCIKCSALPRETATVSGPKNILFPSVSLISVKCVMTNTSIIFFNLKLSCHSKYFFYTLHNLNSYFYFKSPLQNTNFVSSVQLTRSA